MNAIRLACIALFIFASVSLYKVETVKTHVVTCVTTEGDLVEMTYESALPYGVVKANNLCD